MPGAWAAAPVAEGGRRGGGGDRSPPGRGEAAGQGVRVGGRPCLKELEKAPQGAFFFTWMAITLPGF